MRKMEWCFSNNFIAYIENHLRTDIEKRQLPAPVFNSRYAIELLQKLVDDILFFVYCFKLFFRILLSFSKIFSLTPLHLFMKRIRINIISIGDIMNLLIHHYN